MEAVGALAGVSGAGILGVRPVPAAPSVATAGKAMADIPMDVHAPAAHAAVPRVAAVRGALAGVPSVAGALEDHSGIPSIADVRVALDAVPLCADGAGMI